MVDNRADQVKAPDADLPDANAWMQRLRVEVEQAAMDQNNTMGSIEKLIEHRLKELARPMLQYGAQLLADNQPMLCPRCDAHLQVEEHGRERNVTTLFGELGTDPGVAQ